MYNIKSKIKNIWLFVKLSPKLFYFRNKPVNNPRKILIIQLAKLGDMVCTTPMFRAVKEKYPDCEVLVIGNALNKELIGGNKDINGYIIANQDMINLARQIRDMNFDFACVTGPSFEALATLILSGVKVIAVPRVENGFSPYETKLYKILSKFVITKSHRMGSYAPREYLRLLEPIGIFTNDTKKHLAFSEIAAKRAGEILKPFAGKLVIGIAPAAGNKIKEWPTKRFAEVADYAAKKYDAVIIIIGGEGDLKHAEEIKLHLSKNTSFIDTTGTLSIEELKALVSKLNLFISVDTGPIYIAEAFGVPTIDIIGPMDEKEQPPVGGVHLLVFDQKRKKPAIHILNSRIYDFYEARRQVETISSKNIFTAIDNIMKRIKETRA